MPGSAPQRRRSSKVGFCFLFFFLQRDLWTFLTQALLSFRHQEHLFQMAFFLTPVQKLPADKPHPHPHPQPQGIVLRSSRLGNLASTCTFKKIWGQIQASGEDFFHRHGLRHIQCYMWVFGFFFLLHQQWYLKCKLFFDWKSFAGHYSREGEWTCIHSELSDSDTANSKSGHFDLWRNGQVFSLFLVFFFFFLLTCT